MASSERFQGANVVDAGRLSPYWGEHAARYVFALPYVERKAVLDIACGTGYGIGVLQQNARFVTGVDVDIEAARSAIKECAENSGIILGDGLQLPFADESFDVVTSFETLEHLTERGKFLSELRRVLKTDGVLVLSTPNANYSLPVNGKPTNPFHIFEYTPDELRIELERHFSIERFLGQHLCIGSSLSPFYAEQQRLPKDPLTQAKLLAWRLMNKIPIIARERLSSLIWKKPFYPTEADYEFSADMLETAPVQVAVCRKK